MSQTVSLVICTRDRARYLEPCLEALTQIAFESDWEVIFVDNASSDLTPEVLGRFCKTWRGSATIIRESRLGLGAARNAGWRASRGEVVCFTDDDCYPDEDFLSRLAEAFEDPVIGFVGGRVLLFDPADLPITIKTAQSGKTYAAGSFIGPGELHGANFAFRRVVLEQIGGFDPALGAGTAYPCEDCDALLRASEAGWAGRYDPSVVVYHHHRRRGEGDRIKIEKAYLWGRGAFYAKALINSKRRMRVVGAWARSMRWFGISAGLRELYVGGRFLLEQRRAGRLQRRS